MKKTILALLLCLAMVLPLAACGGGDTTTEPSAPDPGEEDVVTVLSETDGRANYRVVLPTEWRNNMVNDTVDSLVERFAQVGSTLIVSYDSSSEGSREIIIGNTKRAESAETNESLAARDWCIKTVGEDIVINGGSLYSTCLALDSFMASIQETGGMLVLMGDFTADYCYDRDNTETVYGTLDEKLAQFGNPNGRLMVTSHRGEHINCPENSRAAILSAIAAGADILELDVRRTKDGHYILNHDSTLTRTTNVEQLAGKNGLPTSTRPEDWTLEQLQKLTLKDSFCNETVVTLEEALELCRGRIILDFDKTESAENRLEVYRVAVKMRAVDSVMYQLGNLSHDVMETIYDETGIALPYLYHANSLSDAVNYVKYTYKDVPYAKQAIQIATSWPDAGLAAQVKDKCRLYMNTIGGEYNTGIAGDNANSWKTLFDAGFSIIQSDQPYKLRSYITSRETGSGVDYLITYTGSPVQMGSRANVRFTLKTGDALYYTTDGSEPTAESEGYTGQMVVVSETCTVKCLVVRGDVEFRFEFDILTGSPEFYEMMGMEY